MTDVTELELRITSALDRISTGLGGLNGAQVEAAENGDIAALEEALEAEKTANAQLEERVKAIKEKQESTIRELEAEVSRMREELALKSDENERMKSVNGRLRRNNRALRDANEQGVGDPELINDSMVVELDALRVRRDADRAELDSILVELQPLVEGTADARG